MGMAKANPTPTHFAGGPGVPLHPVTPPPYVRGARAGLDLADPSNWTRARGAGQRLTLNRSARSELDQRVEDFVRSSRIPVKLEAIRQHCAPPTAERAPLWYIECGSSTQRLKRSGRIRLIKGVGAGWEAVPLGQ